MILADDGNVTSSFILNTGTSHINLNDFKNSLTHSMVRI
jgi:hypothetical protein